jgi:acyl-coenzyme A thioesterase PaaI-like protein
VSRRSNRGGGPAGPEISGGARLEISAELRTEWLRLVASLRQALHASVELDAPPGRLRELADRVAEISRELSLHAGGRPVPLSHPHPETLAPKELNATLPFSPVMGRYNPLAPPIDLSLEDERIVARVRLREAHQGFAGLAHGGVVSAIFDEVLAMATIVSGVSGATVSLKVEYRRPTPLHEDLRFEAWIERVQRRRVQVCGCCLLGDEILSEAEGIFVRPVQGRGWIRRGGTPPAG